MRGIAALAVVVVVMLLGVSSVAAQDDTGGTPEAPPQIPTTGGNSSATGSLPGAPGPLLEPVDVPLRPSLFPPARPIGPIVLTPSFTLSEVWNDNVFLTSSGKISDFITGFTPGLSLLLQKPGTRLDTGYNLTGQVYAKESQLNNVVSRQEFFSHFTHSFTPRMTGTANGQFVYDKSSNAVNPEGISSGRRESWRVNVSGQLSTLVTNRLTVRVNAAEAVQHFGANVETPQGVVTETTTVGARSTYTTRVGAAADYVVSPRLTATGSYDAAYLIFDQEKPALTQTPRIGARYQLTRTISLSASAGPSFVVEGGDLTVAPVATFTARQTFEYVTAAFTYDRTVGTAGGVGGATVNQSFSGSLNVVGWLRGLTLGVRPRYGTSTSVGSNQREPVDLRTITTTLDVRYEFTPTVAIIGSYLFYSQHSGATSVTTDVDQNRVFVGLQIGYPIALQ